MTAVAEPTAAATPEGNAAAGPAAAGTPAAAPVTPVVPEKYTLAKPDGSLLSDEAIARAGEIAKGLKLPTDADAQQVLAFAHEQTAEVVRTYEQARQPDGAVYKALVQQYEADSLAHPDLGAGDANRLAQKSTNAGLFVKQFGPEFADVLKATGAAAHPAFLLMANRAYAAMQEKALAGGTPVVKDTDPVKSLFPDGIPDDVGATNQRP